MADKLVQGAGRRPQFLATGSSPNPRIREAEAAVSCALAWKSYIVISAVFYRIHKPALVNVVVVVGRGETQGCEVQESGLIGRRLGGWHLHASQALRLRTLFTGALAWLHTRSQKKGRVLWKDT